MILINLKTHFNNYYYVNKTRIYLREENTITRIFSNKNSNFYALALDVM